MDWDWLSWLSKSPLNPTLVHEYGLAFALNELEEDDISYFDHPFLQSMGISVAKHRLEILKLVHNHIHMHSHHRTTTTTYINKHSSNWRRHADPVTLTTTRLLVRSVSQLLKLTRRRMGSFLNNLILPAAYHHHHLQDHEESQSNLILLPCCNNRSSSSITAGGGATWRGDVIINRKSRQLSGSSSTKMEKRTLLVLTSGGGSCPPTPSPVKVTKRSHSFPASPAVMVNSGHDKKKKNNNNGGGGGGGVQAEEMMRWDSLFRDLRPT